MISLSHAVVLRRRLKERAQNTERKKKQKDSSPTTVRFGCGEDEDDDVVVPERAKYTHTHARFISTKTIIL